MLSLSEVYAKILVQFFCPLHHTINLTLIFFNNNYVIVFCLVHSSERASVEGQGEAIGDID